jgi:hypothetical protein
MINNFTSTNSVEEGQDLPEPVVVNADPGYADNTWDYDVTVNDYENLDSLYDDLEIVDRSPPNSDIFRPVECVNRFPNSKVTTFRLTHDEADRLRQDARVLAVELAERHLGVERSILAVQYSDEWSKSYQSTRVNPKNWALLRCLTKEEPTPPPLWAATSQYVGVTAPPELRLTTVNTGTIELTMTGRNVDVVIVDEPELPWDHPELAVNADGTGGSRAQYYNWYQHNPAVNGNAAGTYWAKYEYGKTQYANPTWKDMRLAWFNNSSHGSHVTGIVAGNTNGWARDANVYRLNFNDPVGSVWGYVKEFHKNKPINPVTGKKNPTIMNNSWGSYIKITTYTDMLNNSLIKDLTYQGTYYEGLIYDGDAVKIAGFYTYDSAGSLVRSRFNGMRNCRARMTVKSPQSGWNTNLATFFTATDATLSSINGLVSSTTPTSGNNDNGYWKVDFPFPVPMGYVGNVYSNFYNSAYVSTNGYITFDAAATISSGFSATNPAGPKIIWNAGNRSVQRIYYGVSAGSAQNQNRQFSIRIEGNGTNSGTVGSPGMLVEVIFYENTSTKRIEVIFGQNNGVSREGVDFGQIDLQTSFGLNRTNIQYGFGYASVSVQTRLTECIDAGVIVVCAACNDNHYVDVPGGVNYNNSFTTLAYSETTPIYYHRGVGPGAYPGSICVGNADSAYSPMVKSATSNCGPRVDIYAPGTYIISLARNSGIIDTRAVNVVNTLTLTGPYYTNWYFTEMSGTSMASPQVAGVLACLAEIYPDMTQNDALKYLTTNVGEISTTSGHIENGNIVYPFGTPYNHHNDVYSTRSSQAKFLYYNAGEKSIVGPVSPKANYKLRPTSGVIYPRTKNSPRSSSG